LCEHMTISHTDARYIIKVTTRRYIVT